MSPAGPIQRRVKGMRPRRYAVQVQTWIEPKKDDSVLWRHDDWRDGPVWSYHWTQRGARHEAAEMEKLAGAFGIPRRRFRWIRTRIEP